MTGPVITSYSIHYTKLYEVPIVWPCDNDFGIVKDYWDDQKSADASAYSSARVLQKFLAWRNSDQYNPRNNFV